MSPWRPADPPGAAFQAVAGVVQGLADRHGYWTPLLARDNPGAAALAFPHRVAALSLDSIARDDLPMPFEIEAWRWVLLGADQQFIGAAEAAIVEKTHYRFGRVNEGPYVAGFGEALDRALAWGLEPEAYEPVLLVAHAVNLVSLLLKRRPGQLDAIERGDVVIVLPPAPADFRPLDKLELEPFLRMLRGLAARVPRTRRGVGG